MSISKYFGLAHITASEPYRTDRAVSGLPPEWLSLGANYAGYGYLHSKLKISVITSLNTMKDGTRYINVSCSYHNRLPDREDIKLVKETFLARMGARLSICRRRMSM